MDTDKKATTKEQLEPAKRIFFWVFAVLIGWSVVCYSAGEVSYLRASVQDWKATDGRLESLSVYTGFRLGRGLLERGTYYAARYTYVVNGHSYTSHRYSFGEQPFGEEYISFEPEIKVGAPVKVYYNPTRPSEAALDITSPTTTFWTKELPNWVIACLAVLAIFKFVNWQESQWAKK